jgi:hypothetical protein
MKQVWKRPLDHDPSIIKRTELILGMNLLWHDMSCWDDIPDSENASQHTPKVLPREVHTNTKEIFKVMLSC